MKQWHSYCLNLSMKFIEALKLRSKLFFLFILVTSGLITIGIMGTVNIGAMKKNLDSLYFGSLVPVTELNEILQTYHGNLANVIYKAKANEISSDEINLQIKNAAKKIDNEWNSYEEHFKRDEELQYVGYVAVEINSINDYFLNILRMNKNGESLDNLSIKVMEENISHIHKTIKKLIKYEVDMAMYERKNFLVTYDSILREVGLVLFIIILGVLIISFYVFKSIQKDQTKLEIATKKLKKANKKLENVSYTDSLTSLHNRRYFNFVYDKELKRAKREKKFITFMMLDIDYFKQYNDTYGPIEGDNALKNVANVLKGLLKRPSDYVFRLGGEEFGVILSDIDENNSSKVAQKICDSIRDCKIPHESSSANEFVTISIGVACCVADEALDEELLLTKADEMLYIAKEDGRDRFKITTDVTNLKDVE